MPCVSFAPVTYYTVSLSFFTHPCTRENHSMDSETCSCQTSTTTLNEEEPESLQEAVSRLEKTDDGAGESAAAAVLMRELGILEMALGSLDSRSPENLSSDAKELHSRCLGCARLVVKYLDRISSKSTKNTSERHIQIDDLTRICQTLVTALGFLEYASLAWKVCPATDEIQGTRANVTRPSSGPAT